MSSAPVRPGECAAQENESPGIRNVPGLVRVRTTTMGGYRACSPLAMMVHDRLGRAHVLQAPMETAFFARSLAARLVRRAMCAGSE